MANISDGTIVPYAKINNKWVKGSTIDDLMECLASISYDCEGDILTDNRIAIHGRWSIYSTYSGYLPNWDNFKVLKTIMKQHQIEELKIYYSDIEIGIGFMDFGNISIKVESDTVEVESDCFDFATMEKSKDWNKFQIIYDFILDYGMSEVEEEIYEELEEARTEHFYQLEQQFFKTINL